MTTFSRSTSDGVAVDRLDANALGDPSALNLEL
jgi:hypothetical protein